MVESINYVINAIATIKPLGTCVFEFDKGKAFYTAL